MSVRPLAAPEIGCEPIGDAMIVIPGISTAKDFTAHSHAFGYINVAHHANAGFVAVLTVLTASTRSSFHTQTTIQCLLRDTVIN